MSSSMRSPMSDAGLISPNATPSQTIPSSSTDAVIPGPNRDDLIQSLVPGAKTQHTTLMMALIWFAIVSIRGGHRRGMNIAELAVALCSLVICHLREAGSDLFGPKTTVVVGLAGFAFYLSAIVLELLQKRDS